MHKLSIKTHKKREIVDLTDTIEELLGKQRIDGSDSAACPFCTRLRR